MAPAVAGGAIALHSTRQLRQDVNVSAQQEASLAHVEAGEGARPPANHRHGVGLQELQSLPKINDGLGAGADQHNPRARQFNQIR